MVDKIKYIFIVLVLPTKSVFKHLKICYAQHVHILAWGSYAREAPGQLPSVSMHQDRTDYKIWLWVTRWKPYQKQELLTLREHLIVSVLLVFLVLCVETWVVVLFVFILCLVPNAAFVSGLYIIQIYPGSEGYLRKIPVERRSKFHEPHMRRGKCSCPRNRYFSQITLTNTFALKTIEGSK